ncbi:MAG: 23S rRNA (guanosine(2251)-2'-O)-methyltransferase RlmB [Polyangiaceae bacterium]
MSRQIMGIQPVREVLRARRCRVHEVLVEEGRNPKLEGLAKLATDNGAPVRRVPSRELDRLAKGGRHQGVLATADELRVRTKEELLEELAAVEAPTVLILDGIMDPQNFGAAVRGAVALGAEFVVWPEHSSAPLSPAMFRASAGAVEHARLARVRALPDLVHDLVDRGFTVLALDAKGDAEIATVDLRGPVAVVVGSEDKGSRGAVRRAASALVRLPMTKTIDSLNASVAAALALYEIRRQRTNAS